MSALFQRPAEPSALLVLGHGAGSTLAHPLMDQLSQALHAAGIATLRYNYPYSERGRGMDTEPVRLATVAAAVELGRGLGAGLPLFAGGHSMSGRMTSMACTRAPLAELLGIVFFAFPLHSGPPETARARHLSELSLPMLFLSGSRDKLANAELLTGVVAELPSATLELVEGADHSFKVPKRQAGALAVPAHLAQRTRAWMDRVSQRR